VHTNKRLLEHGLLTLKDESLIRESKFLWKWNNKTVPKSLNKLIEEKVDRLRGRRFVIPRRLKPGNINSKLTKQANSCMPATTNNKPKKVLSKSMKKKVLESYNIPCRVRNCFTCSRT